MDLLTNSGWSPVNSIESILIQIRTEMVEGEKEKRREVSFVGNLLFDQQM